MITSQSLVHHILNGSHRLTDDMNKYIYKYIDVYKSHQFSQLMTDYHAFEMARDSAFSIERLPKIR